MRTSTRLVFILVLAPLLGAAQPGDSTRHTGRLPLLIAGGTVAYGISLYGLNRLWYADSPRQSFHFFDDNAEWKQVDKAGHFYSAFYVAAAASHAVACAGTRPSRAHGYGAVTGFLVMAPVEIMDGFSTSYGASVGDLLANLAGAATYYAEVQAWGAPRVLPKFSFHTTSYAPLRPDVLGANTLEALLKDYNGQTYWLSVDMDKFMTFPRWLNVCVGYGAEGMVYARESQNTAAGYADRRQYYLGIDFDLTAIPTHSRFLRSLLAVASLVRLPAPAIEFSNRGITFHPLYF